MLLEIRGEITPERMKGWSQSYDPLIVLLNIYLEKTIIQKNIYTPLSISAQFTIAKTWEQCKCSSADKWIRMSCSRAHTHTHTPTHTHTHTHTHTEEYYSAKKKDKILPLVAIWIDIENIMLSEKNQR